MPAESTDPIPFDADAATVQAELEALSNLSPGEVLVVKLTDHPDEQEWQIRFTGPLAGTNVSQITIDASSVYDGVGAPTDSEGTTTQGAKVNEVQVITLSDTTGGTFTLSFGGQSTPGQVEETYSLLSGWLGK